MVTSVPYLPVPDAHGFGDHLNNRYAVGPSILYQVHAAKASSPDDSAPVAEDKTPFGHLTRYKSSCQ